MDAAINMLLSNAVSASLLAVLVLVVTRIWKNHFGAHVLWLLVLIKLLTPPLIGVLPPALVSGLMQKCNVKYRVAMLSRPPDPRDNNQLFIEHPGEVSNRLQPYVNGQEPFEPQLTLRGIFVAIWLAGSVTWCLLASYRLTRFARVLRHHSYRDDQIQKVAEKVATTMRLRRCPQVVFTRAKVPPFVWAALRPALVVLPRDLVIQLDPVQLETLLAHELAHLRRGDHWIRRYEMVVAAIYWWHPVVWWAVHELRIAEEKCCDALVVQSFPNEVERYAEVLLRAAELACSPAPKAAITLCQGIQLKRRINMILNEAFSRRLSFTASLTLVVVAVAVLPLTLQGDEPAKYEKRPLPDVESQEEGRKPGPPFNKASVRAVVPSHRLISRSGGSFRNGAAHLLEIDAAVLVKNGGADPDSPAWKGVHKDVKQLVDRVGPNQLLHVRFYFARGVYVNGLADTLTRHVKRMMADIGIYLVCVDSHHRNDKIGWKEYVSKRASSLRQPHDAAAASLIRSMEAIEEANVQCSLLENADPQNKTILAALVTVRPRGSQKLDTKQAEAIRRVALIALPGLSEQHVTVVDINSGVAYPSSGERP